MPTGLKTGLNPARKVGSGPDNKGLNTYTIASGYATALGKGDPVKLDSGNLVRGTNSGDAIGVFMGVKYVDATGNIVFTNYWTPNTVATEIEALVLDDPFATFRILADASVGSVTAGQIYALNLTDADAFTRQSQVDVDVAATVAAASGAVKVISVVDAETNELEVVLVNHALRDDG